MDQITFGFNEFLVGLESVVCTYHANHQTVINITTNLRETPWTMLAYVRMPNREAKEFHLGKIDYSMAIVWAVVDHILQCFESIPHHHLSRCSWKSARFLNWKIRTFTTSSNNLAIYFIVKYTALTINILTSMHHSSYTNFDMKILVFFLSFSNQSTSVEHGSLSNSRMLAILH